MIEMLAMSEDTRTVRAEKFGEWFSSRIDDLGFSYVEVARHMGVHRNVVYRWAKGLHIPRPEACTQIAQAMGLDPNEVLAAAGYVADNAGSDRQQLMDLVRYLPDSRVQDALMYLRFLVKQ